MNGYIEHTETYTGRGSVEYNEASSIVVNSTVHVDHTEPSSMNVNGSVGNTEAASMVVMVPLITLRLFLAVTVPLITLKFLPRLCMVL